MKTPPHLPPRSCSVPAYYVRQSLPWIAVVVVLSVLSGVAAALAISAWAVPEGNIAALSDRILLRRTVAADALDASAVNYVTTRLLDVYDVSKETRYHTVAPDALLGRALLLSSDGWAVFYGAKNIRASDLILVDSQGVSYVVEEMVADARTGLTYIHLSGNGFRVAAFGQLHNEIVNAWAFTGEKQAVMVKVEPPRLHATQVSSVALGEPSLLPYVDGGALRAGTVVTNEQGEVFGIVGSEQTLIPAWMLEHGVRQVIRDRKVVYPNIGIEGTLVALLRTDAGLTRTTQMVVSRVTGRARDAGVRVGDRIERVNGASVSFDTLTETVLRATELRLDIARNDENISVIIATAL